MSLIPRPGLVIKYDFLWKEENKRGQTYGKDRPCAIVMTTKPEKDGTLKVVLCPITHAPPLESETAVEVPGKVAKYLGLDGGQSWIKTHQVNTVIWEKDRIPFGVSPASREKWEYGLMPHALGKKVFDQVCENIKNKAIKNTIRGNEPAYKI
jgi:mRNA-degrading endonuclease toxin of MazEF toxin-antitoxin module